MKLKLNYRMRNENKKWGNRGLVIQVFKEFYRENLENNSGSPDSITALRYLTRSECPNNKLLLAD